MNKKEKFSIAILLMILVISMPIAFAVEIQEPKVKVDIPEDVLKEENVTEELKPGSIYGEEIIVNVVDYRPKIVTSNLLEENRLPVIAKLKGILSTPFLKKEDVIIRNVNIIKRGPSKYVSSITSSVASSPGGFTLDDLGTATIWLRKITKEEQVPETIEVNVTVAVRYERRGGEIGAEKLTGLTEQKEEGWTWANPFFGNQYYLRVVRISSNDISLYIYQQGTDRPIYTLTLKRGESQVIRLPGVSKLFEDIATVTVDNIYGGGLTAELIVENENCVVGENDFCITDLKVISIDEDDKTISLRSSRDNLVLHEGEEETMTIGGLPKTVKFLKINPAETAETFVKVNNYEIPIKKGDQVGDYVNCKENNKIITGGNKCEVEEIRSNRIILKIPNAINSPCDEYAKLSINKGEEKYTPCGTIELMSSEAQKKVDVTIAPGGGLGVSESEVTFHIGVEKRLIKLTPEEIDEQINKTKEQIKKLDKIIGDLEKVVKVWMTACFITFTVLTIKNFFTGLTGGALARRMASAEIKKDYDEYRNKGGDLPYDMWFSRYDEYPDGKTPKQKQTELERNLKTRLRELQSEARLADKNLDKYIGENYKGNTRIAFELEKPVYKKDNWQYYRDETGKIAYKIKDRTNQLVNVPEDERKEIEELINPKKEESTTAAIVAIPSIEELTGRVIKEIKITSLIPKEISDSYYSEEDGLVRELKDKKISDIYGEEISAEMIYDEQLREIKIIRIRDKDNKIIGTVRVEDLDAWAKTDVEKHKKYSNMLKYIDTKNIEFATYNKLLGLTKRPVRKPVGEQCTDVMSPTDCSVLFFACDPVMCPSSRFNLGGRVEVPNVIQSGLIGSLILGLPRRTVCLSGVLAALKNLRSVLQGYVNCLVAAKVQGTSVGICDKIRSIFLCEIIWQTIIPLLKEGVWNWISEHIFGPIIGFGKGEGEYFSGEAIRGVRASIDYFTKSYASTIFAAYNAKSTKEIGTEICKRMYYGKLPGVGDFIDEMMAAGNPTQYFAILSVKPYSEAMTGEARLYHSAYQVYYHIYAGGLDITYAIVLKGVDVSGRALPDWYLKRPTLLRAEEFADETFDSPGPEGYNQICIVTDGKFNCGFGKVTSSSFAANEINKYFIQHDLASNIKSESDCRATFEGVLRQCSSENPGGATNPDRWVKVGSCEDLGTNVYCWLDASSIQGEAAQNLFYETRSCRSEIGGDICDANQICVGGEKVESSETVRTADFCCKSGICANNLITEVKSLEDKDYGEINLNTKSNVGDLLKQADSYFEKDYIKASDYYEEIKEGNYNLDPDQLNYINYKLGITYYNIAQEQNSKEYAKKAVDILNRIGGKYKEGANYFSALSYIILGEYDNAINLLNSISEAEFKDYADFYRGYAYELRGKLEKAKEIYESIKNKEKVKELVEEHLNKIEEISEEKKKDTIREIRGILRKPSLNDCNKIQNKIKDIEKLVNPGSLSKEDNNLLAEANFLLGKCYYEVAGLTPRPAYYDTAITAFENIKDSYQGSEYSDDILFYLGKSYLKVAPLKGNEKDKFDQKSREVFSDLIKTYPNSEYYDEVIKILGELRGTVRTSTTSGIIVA